MTCKKALIWSGTLEWYGSSSDVEQKQEDQKYKIKTGIRHPDAVNFNSIPCSFFTTPTPTPTSTFTSDTNDGEGQGQSQSDDPTQPLPKPVQQVEGAHSEAEIPSGTKVEVCECDWNANLVFHLIPKSQLKELELSHLQNTTSVSVSFGSSPQRVTLTKLLRTGRYVGCVHISKKEGDVDAQIKSGRGRSKSSLTEDRNLREDMELLILLYSRGKQATVGFLPTDQKQFVSRLLHVIPDHTITSASPARTPSSQVLKVENLEPEESAMEVEVDLEEDVDVKPSQFWDYQLKLDDFNLKPPARPLVIAKVKAKSEVELEVDFPPRSRGIKSVNFFKGCKWAPDGSCLLSNSDDDILRLFNVPPSLYQIDWSSEREREREVDELELPLEGSEMTSVLDIHEGGQVYDYAWYPLMSSYDPPSCCLLTTTSDAPLHLWDAFTGQLRASYLAYNQVDQVIAASSVAFDPTGEYIYAGFDSSIRTFNITRPGRDCQVRKLKQSMSELSQPGIVSSIAINPTLRSVLAVGSYLKTVGLYHEDGNVLCILQGHLGGVTHLKFSNDGTKLFTGGRKDSRLICWDMRFMGEEYKIYDRVVGTNQRIYFDLTPNDKYLVSGGTDGVVKIWDVSSTSESAPLSSSFTANLDCVNGISVNPFIPLLATSSGQRHLPPVINSDSSDSDSDPDPDNSESKLKSSSGSSPQLRSRTRSSVRVEERDIKLWRFS